MKKVLVALLAVTLLFSCDSDDEGNSNENELIVKKETLSAKWMVDGATEYESFEFNEAGNYIIVKNSTTKSTTNQIVLFGTYTIIDDVTISLSDFGIITISNIDDNSISFSVQLTDAPESEIIIVASKKEEIESTTRTDLLCRTWEMVTVNDEPVTGTEMELTVLFSKAGTYFVSFANPVDENDGGLAQWKWKDDAETQLLYSWDEIPVWSDANFVDIPELTSISLQIIENELTYILRPATNTKSAKIKICQDSSTKATTGFFKN